MSNDFWRVAYNHDLDDTDYGYTIGVSFFRVLP